MKRIRLLISDTTPLFPPRWGGAKRIWYLYSNLPQHIFDIKYIGLDFVRGKKYKVKKLNFNFKEFIIPRPFSATIWQLFEEPLLNEMGHSLYHYLMPKRIKKFKDVVNSFKSDVLISSHPWAGYCMERNGKLFVYDAHNCEYYLMRLLFKEGIISSLLLRKIKKIEQEVINKSDMIFTCSELDKSIFKEIYNIDKKEIYVIPNGAVIRPIPSEEEKKWAKIKLDMDSPLITFVGSIYKPNIEAMNFILNELAPKLKNCNFVIAGSVCKGVDKRKLPSNVYIFPECDEFQLEIIMKATDIAINPVQKGSGTNLKLLDYLSYGLPVITTLVGKRGLPFKDGKEVLVSELDKFPDAIETLLGNVRLYTALRENGYKAVKEGYDWRKIAKKVEEIIMDKLGISICQKGCVYGPFSRIGIHFKKWRQGEIPPPYRVHIMPTNKCNLRCIACWRRDSDVETLNKELPKERLLEIAKEAAELGVKEWEINGGGEPLMMKDTMLEFMKEIKRLGMNGSLVTNGTLLDYDTIDFLVKIGWDHIVISLDGANEDLNDYLRPPKGTFKRVIKALDILKEYKKICNSIKPFVDIYCVLSKANIDEIDSMMMLAVEKNVNHVNFKPIKPYSKSCQSLLLSKEDFLQARDKFYSALRLATKYRIATNLGFLIESYVECNTYKKEGEKGDFFKKLRCYEPWYRLVIYADGYVVPCCMIYDRKVNIFENSLRENLGRSIFYRI